MCESLNNIFCTNKKSKQNQLNVMGKDSPKKGINLSKI